MPGQEAGLISYPENGFLAGLVDQYVTKYPERRRGLCDMDLGIMWS